MRYTSLRRQACALAYATALWGCLAGHAVAQAEPPTLHIDWPPTGANLPLGSDAERAIGVLVRSNFKLLPAGRCGDDKRCGHIHLKIDPSGDGCNLPGRPYNSMNSDFGGPLIKANFGACTTPQAAHVIGVLLADDNHQPVLHQGKPITALVEVKTTLP